MCKDLLPLVNDGVASRDSQDAVKQHVETCEACRNLYKEKIPPADGGKILAEVERKLQHFFLILMSIGIFFGLSITPGNDMFCNSLIMPLAGILGYVIFGWKAAYRVPLLVLGMFFVTNLLGLPRGEEHFYLFSILLWSGIYSVFVVLGVLIAGLFHFAAKKSKIWVFVIAGVMLAGIGLFANALVGNPVSEMLARKSAEKYLAENYGDKDFYIENVNYSFKTGGYYARIESPGSMDGSFSLSFGMDGRLLYDSYEHRVLGGANTGERLDMEYRELVSAVLEAKTFPFESDIAFGSLSPMFDRAVTDFDFPEMKEPPELVPDKLYDIRELGKNYGELCLYVQEEEVTVERAAEILLAVRKLMDESGVPFFMIDFTLQHPRPEGDEPWQRESIAVLNFPYDEIYEDGMVQQVQKASETAAAYYAGQEK